jgi:hypothetical protein
VSILVYVVVVFVVVATSVDVVCCGCCYSNGPYYLSLVFSVAVVLTLKYKIRTLRFDVFVSHLFYLCCKFEFQVPLTLFDFASY